MNGLYAGPPGGKGVSKVSLKFLNRGTLTNGVRQIALTSNGLGSSVISNIGDQHKWFRITRMEVLLYPPNSLATNEGVLLTYMPGADLTTPVDHSDVESPYVVYQLGGGASANLAVPAVRLRIPRAALISQVQWYATNSAATEPGLDTIGSLFLVSTLITYGGEVSVLIDVDVEFKGLLDPDVTSLRLMRHIATRDRRFSAVAPLIRDIVKKAESKKGPSRLDPL